MNYQEKMEKLQDLMSEIRNYYNESVPPLYYYCGDTFEHYTELDLEDDIKTCEQAIAELDMRAE